MPKPIINTKVTKEEIFFNKIEDKKMSFKTPEQILRKRRSKEYIEKLKKIDILGHNISQDKIDEIINVIKNELPEILVEDLPIGIVAKCYLGESYEVHTLSMIGQFIVQHYKKNESLPEELEKARTLANNENYKFVEVYRNKLIAVKEDGSTAIIEDKK